MKYNCVVGNSSLSGKCVGTAKLEGKYNTTNNGYKKKKTFNSQWNSTGIAQSILVPQHCAQLSNPAHLSTLSNVSETKYNNELIITWRNCSFCDVIVVIISLYTQYNNYWAILTVRSHPYFIWMLCRKIMVILCWDSTISLLYLPYKLAIQIRA